MNAKRKGTEKENRTVILSIAVMTAVLTVLLAWIIIRKQPLEIQVQSGWNDIDMSGERLGILLADRVEIRDTSQKVISTAEFEKFDIKPDHIALGEDGYYLFQLDVEPAEEREENLALIAKFDYQSNFKSKILLPDIVTIGCRDGKLFFSNLITNAGDGDVGNFLRGLYANYYIDEKDFGKKPVKEISQDNTELFYHKAGFFSTEPEIGGYNGAAWYSCNLGDVEIAKEELKGEREKKAFTQICENIDLLTSKSSDTFEYQTGEMLYGVSNVLKGRQDATGNGIPLREVDKCCFYRIDCTQDKFELLKEVEAGYGIFGTENYVVVQKENKLYKIEIGTDKSQILLDMDSDERREILYEFQGSFLRVSDDEKDYYFYWDEQDIREVVSELALK